MGISTLKASEQGRAKIKQAREKRGWTVTEEDDTPLKEASKFLIRQHAIANEWEANDSRWLSDFKRFLRVENPQNIHEIQTTMAQSNQSSFLEQIEQRVETGEILVKGISYGTWSRFASQTAVDGINERAFKAYCHVLGLSWEEIAEHHNPQELESPQAAMAEPNPATPMSRNGTFPSSPVHNLPVRYHTALIGRDTEMTQLLERLCPHHPTAHISVEGMGGAGKTSLVLEAAYRCLQASWGEPTTPLAPRFEAIIFTSAKQQHLIGNHILQRHRRERTLNDIFRAIFRTLECPGSLPADFDEQLECIQNRLQSRQTLLIVDNLETLDDQEAVLSFLYELPPTVKVVITTRFRAAFGVPIYLEGLPLPEAMRLMEHQAQEQRVQLKPDQFQAIYQRTSGLALGIVYAIGQLSVYGVSSDIWVTRLTPANDLAQYCFEDSVQRLRGQLAHRLLMALALFAKSASREAITHIALPAADFNDRLQAQSIDSLEALAQLHRLRLVIQDEERYDMHPLTHEYAVAELKAHSEFEQEMRERWVNWYLSFSQVYRQPCWRQWKEYQGLDQEWENLQAVIDWCIHHNRYEQARKCWQHVKGYTYVHGYWHERLAWIEWLLQAAGQRQDQSAIAEALSDKGWTLTLMMMGKPEQLAEVDALCAQVSNLQAGEDLILQLELTIERAVWSIPQGKFDRAHQLLNRARELLRQVSLEEPKRLRQQIRIDYYEAEVWFRTQNYQRAKIGYQKALEQARMVQWQQVEVYSLNWLADIALSHEGNLEEAERLLKTSMPIALASQDKRSIAFHKRSWAHLEKLRGNHARLQHWAIEAKESFESLGMLAEAQEMQSWLET
ncbi:MAG TPA: ATP-binding protein [Stenomitos sp.]